MKTYTVYMPIISRTTAWEAFLSLRRPIFNIIYPRLLQTPISPRRVWTARRAVFPPPPHRSPTPCCLGESLPAKMGNDDPSRAENESYLERGARSRAACR
jgi:hypothetical protein